MAGECTVRSRTVRLPPSHDGVLRLRITERRSSVRRRQDYKERSWASVVVLHVLIRGVKLKLMGKTRAHHRHGD
jgi:hypothetical protein